MIRCSRRPAWPVKQAFIRISGRSSETEGNEVVVNGQRLIMIGSNNYLGLTTHPKVRQAAIDAITHYGTSCTGSRFLNGTLEIHKELERRLANFLGKEAALIFGTGYQSNLGAITALMGSDDVAVCDKEVHACIVDAVKMAGCKMKRWRHNDIDDLERVLRECKVDTPKAGVMVIVDGVYSMGGDLAPLPEIIDLCKKYGARFFVDDAHGLGVMGQGGRGTHYHFNRVNEVDLVMGTFSKSFASLGGVIVGDESVIRLHPASCALADLQRQHAAGECGHRAGLPRCDRSRPQLCGARACSGRQGARWSAQNRLQRRP